MDKLHFNSLASTVIPPVYLVLLTPKLLLETLITFVADFSSSEEQFQTTKVQMYFFTEFLWPHLQFTQDDVTRNLQNYLLRPKKYAKCVHPCICAYIALHILISKGFEFVGVSTSLSYPALYVGLWKKHFPSQCTL